MTTNSDLENEIRTLRMSDPDLIQEEVILESKKQVDNETRTIEPKHPYRFVPLAMDGRTHTVSKGSQSLMKEINLDDLQRMTTSFYQKAFQDPTLDQFIRAHRDPHASRFAKWIHQKLSGSNVWDLDRRERDKTPVTVAGGHTTFVHDRSSAHVAAWYSLKRPEEDVGRHFKLDESRVWMRLHFWALRESGLMEKSPTFVDYYIRFIGHFVRVYESSAQQFARESFRWSANPENIERYLREGKMIDVLGLSFDEAKSQIPEEEANDSIWPYNRSPVSSRNV